MSMDHIQHLYCHEEDQLQTAPPPQHNSGSLSTAARPQVVYDTTDQQLARLARMDHLDLLCHEQEDTAYALEVDQPQQVAHYSSDEVKEYLDLQVVRHDQMRVPSDGAYVNGLQLPCSAVCRIRSQGVQYIFHAFFVRFGLELETSAAVLGSAVSYLDRYLSNIKYHELMQLGFDSMRFLKSMACLALAYKLEGAALPTLSLRRLQDQQCEPWMINRMELRVFKALDWRLTCPTPFSFLAELVVLTQTVKTATSPCTRLLKDSLADPFFVKFHAFVMAVSAFRCVALEDERSGYVFEYIKNILPPEGPAAAAMDDTAVHAECFSRMKGLFAKTLSKEEQSPNSVLSEYKRRSADDDYDDDDDDDDDTPPAKRRILDS